MDMNATKSTIHLVQELKSFEKEYKSIVNKLPHDCGAVSGPSGIYLISPGDGEPILAYCKEGLDHHPEEIRRFGQFQQKLERVLERVRICDRGTLAGEQKSSLFDQEELYQVANQHEGYLREVLASDVRRVQRCRLQHGLQAGG
jgi:hypothetical protein